LRLSVEIPDIDAFLTDRRHRAQVSGWVDCAALGGSQVVRGTLELLVSDDAAAGRRMFYRMNTVGRDGEPRAIVACKDIQGRSAFDLWRDTTRMRVRVYGGTLDEIDYAHSPYQTAKVRLPLRELIRMTRTFKAFGPGRARTSRRFMGFFAGELLAVARGTRKTPSTRPVRVAPFRRNR
jgi:cholesterol oxidase